MKIRTGFVSNSSSSSFLVIFPKEPKSIEEVKEILFGDATTFFKPYGDGSYPTIQIAETIFKDIQAQEVNDFENAIEELTNSHDGPSYEDFKIGTNWGDIDWDAHLMACEKWAKEKFEEFYSLKKIRKNKLQKIKGENIETNTGEVFYIFEYGDDSGSYYTTLEHGGTFENLKHITISKH